MTRRAFALAAILALVCLLAGYTAGRAAGPASRSEPVFQPVRIPAAASTQPAPSVSVPGLILDPAVPTQPIPRAQPDQPAAVAVTVSKNRLTGIASWGDDWSGVVTRLPRGTAICVAGALGRWCGPSVGYGPAVWTGRIADLSGAVFRDICGPTSMGLCTVTLTW